jgi:hypothetical protein
VVHNLLVVRFWFFLDFLPEYVAVPALKNPVLFISHFRLHESKYATNRAFLEERHMQF